jgi:hypothetical protein
MQRFYTGSTRALSVLLILLGVALVASTLARGGGATALGVLVGAALAVTGGLRLWLLGGVGHRSR